MKGGGFDAHGAEQLTRTREHPIAREDRSILPTKISHVGAQQLVLNIKEIKQSPLAEAQLLIVNL